MKIAVIGLLVVATGLECEVHQHLKKISKSQEENTDGCNQQNFDMHYLCGLLVATNFRKCIIFLVSFRLRFFQFFNC